MKSVAYVLYDWASGGIEAFVMNVVSKLNRNKYDISFFWAVDDNSKSHQFRKDEALAQGIKIYRTCDLHVLKKK